MHQDSTNREQPLSLWEQYRGDACPAAREKRKKTLIRTDRILFMD
jgi:hypothetical protein